MMSMTPSDVSLSIPTYRRGDILLRTLELVFRSEPPPGEILVVDQTEEHPVDVEAELAQMESEGRIRWLHMSPPSITRAMNAGLRAARGKVVLFLDDDIIPSPGLVAAHRRVYEQFPEAWAAVGRVVQGENAETLKSWKAEREKGGEENAEKLKGGKAERGGESGGRPGTLKSESVSAFQLFSVSGFQRFSVLRKDLDFAFDGMEPAWVENVIACNLSVRRDRALALGGFDENFIPPVSYRFETEFAKRLIAAGGRIRFEPSAEIRHLRAPSGGTRSIGGHLTSISPLHGVGDYTYALKCGRGWERALYIARRPFREVCTRFHLRHPWWIPVKFVGELRAVALALRLHGHLKNRSRRGDPI